jgi:2-polyprenyl-3-methyl-5-hydroxy-6-metoxy-1,4-benzoquinol methylase
MTTNSADSDGTEIQQLTKLFAFYLPQFHPIVENDEAWGRGFTEWRNVVKAKPLFPGHYQPHIPSELGFYDLRLAEVREQQAALAKEYGINGFCYYHYWFHGQRLLEKPFEEVVASGEPDLPFMLCWANEPWTRNWDAQTGEVLVGQHYSDADDLAHIRHLLTSFEDPRYAKIDGRPVFLIYRAKQLPDPKRTLELWREEAQRAGFPDLYLCKVESHGDFDPPGPVGFDANVSFFPDGFTREIETVQGYREHMVLDLPKAIEQSLAEPPSEFTRFQTVIPSWDNTPRRKSGAIILDGASPEVYERWLRRAIAKNADVRAEENIIFIMAWNEWAEGNHLEPDERYGRRWLEATRNARRSVDEVEKVRIAELSAASDQAGDSSPEIYPYDYEYYETGSLARVVDLAKDYLDPSGLIVDFGAGAGTIHTPLQDAGFGYVGLDSHPESLQLMRAQGLTASFVDLNNADSVAEVLDGIEDRVAAFLLIDVIEHLVEPQQLLTTLSSWAGAHSDARLVVSVPNVSHYDLGFNLLLGKWQPTQTGLLDSTHLRFFTQDTLRRLFRTTGWTVVAENNVELIHSDQYDFERERNIPSSVLGALKLLAQESNGSAYVNQFVWILAPEQANAPRSARLSYLDAMKEPKKSPSDRDAVAGAMEDQAEALVRYMESVSVFAVENERKALAYRPLEALNKDLEVYIRKLEAHIKDQEAEDLRKAGYIAAIGARAVAAEEALQGTREQLAVADSALAATSSALAALREINATTTGRGESLVAQLSEAENLLARTRSRRIYRLTVGSFDRAVGALKARKP